jgi:hypothetical protein
MVQPVTLWIVDTLGVVERACLMSVLRQGHGLTLYCYRRQPECREASRLETLPRYFLNHRFSTTEMGSVAICSDWFRYELLKGAGT